MVGEWKAGEKDTWERLLAVFEKKWPKPKAAQHAMDIVLEDISTNILSREDLGKLVKDEDGSRISRGLRPCASSCPRYRMATQTCCSSRTSATHFSSSSAISSPTKPH
jgi:hypothetical protein